MRLYFTTSPDYNIIFTTLICMLAHKNYKHQFAMARQLARGWAIGFWILGLELRLRYMANCYIQSQINNFRPGLEIRDLSSCQPAA